MAKEKNKKVEEVKEKVEVVEEAPVVEEQVEEVEEKAAKKGEAFVYSTSGIFVRKYSSEDHGKDYKKLAEGFAKKIKGSVR